MMKTKTAKRTRRVNLHEAASRWARLKRQEDRIQQARRELGELLLAEIQRRGLDHVQVGRQAVQIIIDHDKRVAKHHLIRFFGEKQAEAFWKSLPDSVSRYLSLVHVVAPEV